MRKKRFDKKGKNRSKSSREDDAAHRLTYLWGAAHLLAETSPALSRFYVTTIRQIGRRINQPLDARTIKRAACKKCHSLLIPGLGPQPCSIRLAPRRETHLVQTCGNCGHVRRYLARGLGEAPTRPDPPAARAPSAPRATPAPSVPEAKRRSCTMQ